MDAERAHGLTLTALSIAGSLAPGRGLLRIAYGAEPRPVVAFGLNFKNPLGLAAGYDKDGRAIRGLAALGFGHIEIGTVTPLPQSGNPRPRLFRLIEDEAIINRLGFPSLGAAYVQSRMQPPNQGRGLTDFLGLSGRPNAGAAARMRRRSDGCILGVNIGKNAVTSNEEAVLDYLALLQNFASRADYLTINVSSPNTVGLRALQHAAALERLLGQLDAQRVLEQQRIERRLPLLVKLGPDLTDAELDAALDAIVRTHMDGVIVTNTTVARQGLRSPARIERGGLSGAPLRGRSELVLRQVVRRVGSDLEVVSAGGILGPEDVRRRLDMGAVLVQIYTGLVYRGPGILRRVIEAV
jgi:dihydroorotate dehydrogenase